MTDTIARLALENGLRDQSGLSPDGLPERYLYSPDMLFRYAFGRWWGNVDLATTAVWVLLNPATGDTERRHRPTLERCISRSRAAGHTGLAIVNLFAFRDTNPRNLRLAPDAVGPANDETLRVITKAGAQTIAAWGGRGFLRGRSARVGPLLESPMCLGVTQRGEPRHPLYVPADTQLVPWVPVRSPRDPQDAKLQAILLQATPTARAQLRAAIEDVKLLIAAGRALTDWSPMSGDGSTKDPHVLTYPKYNNVVPQLIAALAAVNAQPDFEWMRWDRSERYPGGVGLAEAPVADAMRLVTVIVRGERFSDGAIAKAIEDHTLLSAADRIITALDDQSARTT
jgi:hypothetical protein